MYLQCLQCATIHCTLCTSLPLLVNYLRLKEVTHVLCVGKEVGVGCKRVVVNVPETVGDLLSPGAGVRPEPGLLQKAVRKGQREAALNLVVQVLAVLLQVGERLRPAGSVSRHPGVQPKHLVLDPSLRYQLLMVPYNGNSG